MALLGKLSEDIMNVLAKEPFNRARHCVLEIYKCFVLHIPLWKKSSAQEDEHVSRAKEVLNLIFYETDIAFASGETGANCTKVFRQYLESKFGSCFLRDSSLETDAVTSSSSSVPLPVGVAIGQNEDMYFNIKPYVKNLKARKIEIMTLQDKKSGLELACLEFKINPRDLAKNQSKSLRLNKCVMKVLGNYNVFKKEDIVALCIWPTSPSEVYHRPKQAKILESL